MILITGATGHLGKTAIDLLLNKVQPNQITALVRDLKKAENLSTKGIELRQGNYFDDDALVKAFKGIDKLLFISSNALEKVAEQQANVINAAKETGVNHIVYTSMVNASETPHFKLINEYRKTEKDLESSGITYTILRNGFYLDMLPMFIGNALETGKIYYPAGDGKASFAARVDMAEAVANVLTSEGHENKIYHTCANTSYSFYDVAKALSELADKKIEYTDIPLEAMKEELRKNQMSPLEVDLMADIAASIKYNEGNYPSPDLENLLGRKSIGLKEFLKQTYF